MLHKFASRFVVAFLLITVLSGLSACNGGPAAAPVEETATQPSTDTPVPSNTPEPSDTPLPTSTDTPVPTDTPEPTATATPDLMATAAAEAAELEAKKIAEIDVELQNIGLSTKEGKLGWISTEPLAVTTNAGPQTLYAAFAEGQQFSDFVLHADMSWKSTGGLAGCGFFLRAEENLEKGLQYRFNTIRLSGLPLYDIEIWEYGNWQSTLGGNPKSSAVIDQDDGATNSYTIVMQADLFTIYANGERLGRLNSTKLKEGYLAMFTFQDSGESTCTMDNAWVWELK